MKDTENKFPVCKVGDESPHLKDLNEWWFVQGYYEGEKIPRTYFMTTIFREKVELGKKKLLKQLYYLLISVTDPEKKTHKKISQIHQDVLDHMKKAKFNEVSGNLDRNLFDTYINEIKAYGPSSTITINKKDVLCRADPLEIYFIDVYIP